MGLFASRNGKDANGDGYVSPFDTDETQDYVDPSQVLDADNQKSKLAGRPPWTPQESRVSATATAADTATATNPIRTTEPKPMAATSNPIVGRRQSQTRAGSTSRHADASRRVSTMATAAIICAAVAFLCDFSPILQLALSVITAILAAAALIAISRHQWAGKGRAITALVLAVWLIVSSTLSTITLMSLGGNPWTGDWSGRYAAETSLPSSSDGEEPDYSKVKPEDVEPTVLEDEGSLTWAEGSSGDVAIVSARRGPRSYADNPTVIVTYRFTNHAANNTSFGVIHDNVYQHGASLHETSVSDYRNYSAEDPDGLDYYDYQSPNLEIANGASLDVTKAYELRDESDIAVELSSNDPVIIRGGFSLAQDRTDLTRLQASDITNALEPDEGAGTTDTAQWFESWDGYLSGNGVQDSLSFTVRDVTYAGRSDRDVDTAVITIDWENTSKHPIYFTRIGYPKFFQNGVELSTASLSSDSDLYDFPSQLQYLQPGVTGTVTFACELRNLTDQVRMQMSGSDGPEFDQSFPIDGVPS